MSTSHLSESSVEHDESSVVIEARRVTYREDDVVVPVPPSTTAAWPIGSGRSTWGRRAKRALDLAIAPVSLVVLSPVLLAAMLATRLDSPGAPLFQQVRVGVGGRPFTVYKIRTMYVDNDDRAHREYVAGLLRGARARHRGLYKLADDPRITRVGRHLRRLSIDEIPQLINVVKGEMSLVGPRPAPPSEVHLYDEHQLGRLATPPGITGLWQVSGRCELTYREMIELDLEYVERWSLWLDLKILVRAFGTVLRGDGAV